MRGSRGRAALVAGATVLVVVAAAGIAIEVAGRDQPAAAFPGGTVNPATAPVPPAHGAYFGARVRPAVDTGPAEIAAVRNLQGEIGRRLDIVHIFHMWGDPFPSRSDLAFLRQGSMLLLSWSGADTRAVAAGRYDSLIRRRALATKGAGGARCQLTPAQLREMEVVMDAGPAAWPEAAQGPHLGTPRPHPGGEGDRARQQARLNPDMPLVMMTDPAPPAGPS